MTVLERMTAGLMARGQIGAGWYAVLTGAALLYVAHLLGHVAHSDPAASYVVLVLAMAVIGMSALHEQAFVLGAVVLVGAGVVVALGVITHEGDDSPS